MVDDSAETSQKIVSGGGSKLLVLIAEDEFLIKANLEEVVTEAGFEHMAVSNADEAIRTAPGIARPRKRHTRRR